MVSMDLRELSCWGKVTGRKTTCITHAELSFVESFALRLFPLFYKKLLVLMITDRNVKRIGKYPLNPCPTADFK